MHFEIVGETASAEKLRPRFWNPETLPKLNKYLIMYPAQLALIDSRFRADTVIAKEPECSEQNEVNDCGNLSIDEITALRS